jgi:HPt (histidine-containing phosphotransfer) domain-containing protein
MTSTAGVLDDQTIAQLRAIGDLPFFVELIDLYVADAHSRIEDMLTAIAEGNAERLAGEAHALKSSSGNIGAAAVSDLCAELEMAAAEGMPPDAADLVSRLEAEYARAIAELTKAAASM